MKTKLTKLLGLIICLFTSFSLNYVQAQPNGLCNNIQNCNDKNFSATEDDDLHAGEFYNSYLNDNTTVVHSEYTGGFTYDDFAMKAFFGRSYPADWYGVAARLEAGYCALEASTVSDGTDQGGADYFGIYTEGLNGGNNSDNYGIFALARNGSESATAYGVYGRTIGGLGTKYAGYFSGNVNVTGTITNVSDARFKRNTRGLSNSLVTLSKLKAQSYEFKTDEYDFMELPTGLQYGFIAQDVEAVLPNLVSQNIHPRNDNERRPEMPYNARVDYKGINYIGMIPIMVDAINEQTEIIEEKDERIGELENQLDNLLDRIENIETVLELADRTNNSRGASMNQNQPNPTSGITSIGVYLPEQVQSAFLKVYDLSGKEIHSISIQQKGESNIPLNFENQTGPFLYTLFVDGIAIDTKKIITQ